MTAVVAVALAVGLSLLQPRKYSATAELIFQQRSTETLFDNANGPAPDPARQLQTAVRVLESPPVKAKVQKQLGRVPDVSGSPIGQTDVVAVRVVSRDAKLAASAANAYAAAYIDYRRTQTVDDLFAAGQKIQDKLVELQQKIASSSPEQRAALEQNRTFFEGERDKLQLTAQLASGGAAIVREAATPRRPFSPTPVRNAVIALVLGIMLGVGIAFFVEYLDDSVRNKEDLERASSGLPVLGLIPSVATWRDPGQARAVSLDDPNSGPAEAYRTLRTGVQFLGLDRTARMIQVTSASAGEGKTTTIANLAIALARARHPVVAVCCDLRRPRLHEFFGLSNRTGLTSVLLGHRTLAEALQPAPGVERLMILPSGPLPPNPSELLATSRVIETLTSLKREGGFLLIDSPPVLPVTDAVVISRWVDGTLLVCSASTTNRKHLARAVELLNQVGGTVVGTVLNGVEEAAGYQYNGYYGNAPDRRANGEVRASRSRRDSAAKGNGRGAPAPRPAKRR